MCQILLSVKMRPFKCHTLVGGDLEIMKTCNIYKRGGEMERDKRKEMGVMHCIGQKVHLGFK